MEVGKERSDFVEMYFHGTQYSDYSRAMTRLGLGVIGGGARHRRRNLASTAPITQQLGVLGLGLPDLPYFTGDPVFQLRSPASRKEAARETESPVFDYRLIQIGRVTAVDYLCILILIMIHCFGFQM